MFIGFAGFATAILLFFAVETVYAETIVPSDFISVDTVWEKSGNPYVIENDVNIVDGATLTIKAGVNIIGRYAEDSEPEFRPGIYINGGHLRIEGKGLGDNRVKINAIRSVSVKNGSAFIGNADIRGGNGVLFENARVIIATTTIGETAQAISSKKSEVYVEGSRIEENTNGIVVKADQVFQFRADQLPNTGGIGNALEMELPIVPSFHIQDSSLANNQGMSLNNQASFSTDARDNWWGSPGGPQRSGPNRIGGSVESGPWLLVEPPLDPGVETEEVKQCCSSILFIPGFEGTRLYIKEKPNFGTTTNRLWEPFGNGDVEKLYLDSNGSSTNPGIFAGDPIGWAYGYWNEDIYDSFLKSLDSLKGENKIAEWKVFGYDWRKPIAEVVAGRQLKENSSESLIETVEDLASRSKTGKVTLIAHSNGGLVTKYLVKTLVDMGKESLIDTVISVAVPYLGTPATVLGLLHGYDQALLKGFLLNEATARTMGKNMPSVYSLLPSREYFSHVFSPTIAFASTSVPGINPGKYPQEIKTFEDQTSFLADLKNGRATTSDADVSRAIKGNQLLMAAADVLHGMLDPFSWPATIARWGIIGWNAATSKGIVYKNDKDNVVYSASKTDFGDGTVVAPSASYNAGETVALDLKTESEIDKNEITHANILEASSTQVLIKEVVTNPVNKSSIQLPPAMSWGEPDYSKETFSSLIVSTHSPVELHIYDSEGRHTGTIAPPPGVEEGFITAYENKIPGSSFDRFAEGEGEYATYVYLPDDTGQKYSVSISGTGVGSATLRVERMKDGGAVESIEYSLPVTPLTVATTTVTSATTGTTPANLASSTLPIQLDFDGNGSVDTTVHAGTEFDPILQMELIRKTVTTLLGNIERSQQLDKRLVRLEDLIKKGKLPKVKKVAVKIENKIGHIKAKKLTDQDKELIIHMIEAMVAEFE